MLQAYNHMGVPGNTCFWQKVFPFEFSFPDIFGLIKNNRLGIAKNKYEITVKMEQQNPLENEVRTNIQTD